MSVPSVGDGGNGVGWYISGGVDNNSKLRVDGGSGRKLVSVLSLVFDKRLVFDNSRQILSR